MIGLATQIRIHQIRSFGMRRIAICWLEGDEHEINLSENLGVVALEDPPALRLIVGIEDAEPLDLLIPAFLLRPAVSATSKTAAAR